MEQKQKALKCCDYVPSSTVKDYHNPTILWNILSSLYKWENWGLETLTCFKSSTYGVVEQGFKSK